MKIYKIIFFCYFTPDFAKIKKINATRDPHTMVWCSGLNIKVVFSAALTFLQIKTVTQTWRFFVVVFTYFFSSKLCINCKF